MPASERLRDDDDTIVLDAVKRSGRALMYASERLRSESFHYQSRARLHAAHGRYQIAEQIFEDMKASCITMKEHCLSTLLRACANASPREVASSDVSRCLPAFMPSLSSEEQLALAEEINISSKSFDSDSHGHVIFAFCTFLAVVDILGTCALFVGHNQGLRRDPR